MNNKEFDDIIKKKLESLNTEGSDEGWALFKERWNSENASQNIEEENISEDQLLDDKIKQDMQGLRVPFNSKHWIILKKQLELEALFKKKLFVAKTIELVILAFIVLGILNLWPIQNDIYQIPVYDIPMVDAVPVDKEAAEKHAAYERSRKASNSKRDQKISNTAKKIAQTFLPVSVENVSKSELIKNQDASASPEEVFQTETNNGNGVINDGSFEIPFIDNASEIPVQESDVLNAERGLLMASLIPNELEELSIPQRPVGFPDFAVVNKPLKKEEKTYLSFAIGPKMNLVNSPFDPVYGYDPYNTINTNFNISAKIQKEIGPVEVYTGLGYTNTSYVPRLVDEIYEPRAKQFNVATLENIQFKTFNIPVGVKYDIIESKNYEVYAAAGLDMNIIADSDYVIQDLPVGSPAPVNPFRGENEINSNAKLSQKEFNKGIFSGGSLRDNLYATASIGLGMNFKVSSGMGLFFEPRYSHFISSTGIGPNEDKVHAISIDLGVRYQLN